MARFTTENAAAYGRTGGQQSHARSLKAFAQLVLDQPSAAHRVAHLITQGHSLACYLRVIRLSDQMDSRAHQR